MVYFCADDYGMSEESNRRIERCVENGVLNKISILPNGVIPDFKARLSACDVTSGLHINLVEGFPLSKREDVCLLLAEDGSFRYSFGGLLLLSVSPKRKQIEAQLYNEIRAQLQFWKKHFGENTPVFLDSHQHTHMIPLVFRALMRAVRDEALDVAYMRLPAEPILPYILTPSLYLEYRPIGLIKQWVLKMLALVNGKTFRVSNIRTAWFMGVLFSGQVTEKRVRKLLPHYIKLAEKHGRDVEIGFHPGFSKEGEKRMDGSRKSFESFYTSPWRKAEYDALINLK